MAVNRLQVADPARDMSYQLAVSVLQERVESIDLLQLGILAELRRAHRFVGFGREAAAHPTAQCILERYLRPKDILRPAVDDAQVMLVR